MRNADYEKIKQFPHKLVVLDGKDLKYCFDYVYEKYSKTYKTLTELYEFKLRG